jgi:hypothetical protein
MEEVEIEEGSRISLYVVREPSVGSTKSSEQGVIDLSGSQADLIVVGEVLYRTNTSIFALLRDVSRKQIVSKEARLIYSLFSESYECRVLVKPAVDLGEFGFNLQILSEWRVLNRRAYVRVPVEYSVTVEAVEGDRKISRVLLTKDISNSGIGVLTQGIDEFVEGTLVYVSLHLPDGVLEVEASVASVRTGVVGLHFSRLKPEAERRIGRAVFQAQVAKKRLLVE